MSFLTLSLLRFRLYLVSKLALSKLTLDFRVNYLVDPLSLADPLVLLDILSPEVQELATPLGGLIQFPFSSCPFPCLTFLWFGLVPFPFAR